MVYPFGSDLDLQLIVVMDNKLMITNPVFLRKIYFHATKLKTFDICKNSRDRITFTFNKTNVGVSNCRNIIDFFTL